MSRASSSKKTSGKLQGASLETFFIKSTAPTPIFTSTSAGLRPATARPRKEKGRPPERVSPRLARKHDYDSASTSAKPDKKLAVYVSLPSRNSSRSRMSSPSPQDDPDALPLPLLRPRFSSSASALSDLTSIHDIDSSELDLLTSTEDERAASPIPEPPTVTRGTARKRKVAEVPVTPTPTKKRTGGLPSAAKKPRLASPAPSDPEDDMPVLPSSQSDELEISLGDAMDIEPPANADPWHIDDDEDIAGPSSSVHAPTSSVHAPTSSPHSFRTPKRSQMQTPSPTPLDPKTKTAKILAQAKEEARSKVEAEAAQRAAMVKDGGSDDELNLLFSDKLPESDSDEEPDSIFLTFRKEKGKKKADPSPSSSSPVINGSPLANRRPTRERKQAARRPEMLAATSKTAERRKKSDDPIGRMLREKKDAERKGAGEADLIKTELRESSAETEDNIHDMEAAARRAEEGIERAYSGAAYRDDEPHEFDLEKSKKRTIKLLGAKDGEATLKIIEADRLAGEEGGSSRPVEIWARALDAEGQDEMNVDEAPVPFPVWEAFEGESKSMLMLREAWANNVYPRAVNFISASLLDARVLKTSLTVLRSLAEFALSIRPDEAPKKACRALNEMAKKVPNGQVIPFSATLIAQTMSGLGLKAELLEKICSSVPASLPSRAKTSKERQEVLRVMVTLVKNFIVEGGTIPDDEISGIVMAFLIIANDVETALDLRITAMSTIDAVLNLLSDDGDASHRIEALIAREIWTYASTQAPPCQHSIINTFAISNRPSIRICRRVAFHLLLETPPSAEPDDYLALPPLKPIISLLLSTHNGPFAITPKTDYYDLEARAEVLHRMLIGMEEYVALESGKSQVSSTEAMVHENHAQLEQLEVALRQLYGKINDTGAAHLDRSSAKSWIQMIQMRVFYQRLGLKDALSGGRRKGLRKITDFGVASSSKNTSAVASREASACPSGSGGAVVNGMALGA